MKDNKIISLIKLNIAIVILNAVIFSPGLLNIRIGLVNVFQTSLGITIILMSVVIFTFGNYKILMSQNEYIKIIDLENASSYEEALKGAGFKKVFSKEIDILIEQIDRINMKKLKIDNILLQKFSSTEISYSKFKSVVTEIEKIFYINIKSVINKFNIFDEKDYDRMNKEVKRGHGDNKIIKEKKTMYEEYISFVKSSVEDNEEILLKLDKLLLELSKFNSLEDGELEAMAAMKDIDELINKTNLYR